MPRYLECVWSGAEESEHIEIIRRHGKVSEGMGNHWKLWKTLEVAENIGMCGKTSEAFECVAGDREDFGRLVWQTRWCHGMWHSAFQSQKWACSGCFWDSGTEGKHNCLFSGSCLLPPLSSKWAQILVLEFWLPSSCHHHFPTLKSSTFTLSFEVLSVCNKPSLQ